jgi:response regulator RpfG family c-di-GMP phosphodiesterase
VSSILIAENDRQARGLIAGWLADAGYVCATTDTSEALTEVRRQAPEAALITVRAVDDAGMWVLRRLGSESTPVATVALTHGQDLEVVGAAQRVGAFECLPWPSSRAAVVASVQRALDWRFNEAEARRRQTELLRELGTETDQLIESIRGLGADAAQTILLAALEGRAPAIHRHAHRVARTASALGASCQLSPRDLRTLRTAALLREVGKLALPAALVDSTSVARDEDVALWRMHVSVAETVLSAVPTFAPAAAIVASSYERFDGTGYPAGLAGSHIPVAARVLAVAVAYDRLVSTWGLDEPVTHEDANTELIRRAGSEFDPEIVRAWLDVGDRARCC